VLADRFLVVLLGEQRFAQLKENLLRIAVEVRQRAPRSLLLFVEYLSVLPPDPTWPTGLLPADAAEWGRGIARRLGDTPSGPPWNPVAESLPLTLDRPAAPDRPAPPSQVGCPAWISLTTRSASFTWPSMLVIELNTCRTTPARSMT
jgi:hypothetical protein